MFPNILKQMNSVSRIVGSTYEQFWVRIAGGPSTPRDVYPAKRNVRLAAIALPQSKQPRNGYPFVLYYMYMDRQGVPEGWGYRDEAGWREDGQHDWGHWAGLQEHWDLMGNAATRHMQRHTSLFRGWR